MLMPTLAHQIADTLVHGHARRGHQAGHAGHNTVVARRNHVGTRAQNRNKLEHIVIVRSENRRAWNACGDLAAGNRVEPFHPNQNRKDAMPLDERLRRLCES